MSSVMEIFTRNILGNEKIWGPNPWYYYARKLQLNPDTTDTQLRQKLRVLFSFYDLEQYLIEQLVLCYYRYYPDVLIPADSVGSGINRSEEETRLMERMKKRLEKWDEVHNIDWPLSITAGAGKIKWQETLRKAHMELNEWESEMHKMRQVDKVNNFVVSSPAWWSCSKVPREVVERSSEQQLR